MFLALVQYLKHSLVLSSLIGITPSSVCMLSVGVQIYVPAIVFRALDWTTFRRASVSGLAQQKAGAPYCKMETT